jgi:hypothetical protein
LRRPPPPERPGLPHDGRRDRSGSVRLRVHRPRRVLRLEQARVAASALGRRWDALRVLPSGEETFKYAVSLHCLLAAGLHLLLEEGKL